MSKSVLVGDPQVGRLDDHQHAGDGSHLDSHVEHIFSDGYEKFQLSTTLRGASAPVGNLAPETYDVERPLTISIYFANSNRHLWYRK